MNSKTISQIKNTKKYLLSLFDNADVFIEKEEFNEIVVRPKKEYNKNYIRSFLLRIPPRGKFVKTAEYLQTAKSISCSNVIAYDLGEISGREAAILHIKKLIIEYNKAVKNLKILHKNKKIAEIRGICDKFTV